jgi:hypothetical protein
MYLIILLFSVYSILLLQVSTVTGSADLKRQFHAYQDGEDKSRNQQCSAMYERHNAADMHNAVEKYKLWPGLIPNGHSLKPESTLFGVEEALEKIWEHQHPKDCSKVKFFISGNHNGGFGSEIHVLGSALGLAMDMGRVYLQNPLVHDKVQWEMSNPFCHNRSATNLECYYEPWSSCTIYDALGPNAISILRNARSMEYPLSHKQVRSFMWTGDINQFRDPEKLKNFVSKMEGSKIVLLKTMGRLKYGLVPNSLWPLIQCSPMNQTFAYYWWRAVSTTYVMRPNAAALQWMQSHTLSNFNTEADNAIGIYVRRGDKEIEMRIAPLEEYTDGVEFLWKNNYMTNVVNNQDGKRHIFLASEDSKVIDGMLKWQQKSTTYNLAYTNVFDRHGLYAEKSASERRQFGRENHHPDEYLSMMLNVHYLLRSTAWICTMSSNFCRVIDELRATVAAKADHPYLDLSVETCVKTPCVYKGIKYFDWR